MPATLSLQSARWLVRLLARAVIAVPALLAACGGGGGDGPRVLAQPQTITAAAAPALAVDGSATVSASASSGLAVRWASLTPSLCSVDASSGQVQALATGRCQLSADQGGNADWAVAPQLLLTLDISALAQSLSFDALPALVVDQQAMLQARSSAGLTPLVYASQTPELCQLDASTGALLARARGDCRIRVHQAGDARHAAAEATATLAIAGLAQQLSLELPASLAVGNSVPAQASSSSGLAATLTSLTPQVCDISAGRLRALAAGECRTAASQAGDARWAAADDRVLSLQVQRRDQSLSLDSGSVPSPLAIHDSAVLRATASSGLAPRFGSLTPGVCRVDAASGLVQALAAGTCRLQVDQDGDARWAAAPPLQQDWTVQRRTQSLSFESRPALTVGAMTQVMARASSGLAPAYASLSSSVCSVDAQSGQVLPLQSGSCRIVASQDGDASWLPALSQSIDLVVSAATQTLSFAPPPALTLQRQAMVSASASSGLAVRYSSLTPGTCSVDANSGAVQGLAVGDCRIAADQAGDARWAAALQLVQTLFVDFVPQAIAFGTAPSPSVGRAVSVTASASSGLAVRYSSLTPDTCSVDAHSGLVSGLAVGSCLIAADQEGNARHAAAPQAQQTLSVGPSPSQTIQLSSPVATLTIDGSTTLQAAASSGLAVRFASLTPGVCRVDAASGQVLALAIGRCTIAADQAGDATWEAAAQTTLSLGVNGQAQTLAFAAAPSLVVTRTALASASASSGLAPRYSSLTPTVCSVAPGSGLLTGLAVGSCRITADQDGDSRWAAALTATLDLFVDFLSQSISFGAAPSLSANGSASISASASSGLALRFSSLTPDVCSVQASSGIVSGLIAGNCRIAADQGGDAVHAVAPQAVLALAVQHATQSIAAGANPALNVSGSASLVASASSGLGLRYSSLTPAVCSVAADTGVLTGLAAGSCTVQAEQAGDSVWAAAAPVSWTFTVTRQSQSLAFAAAPALQAGGTATVRATASSGLAPSYASLTPAVCSVGSSSGLVQALAAGSCSIAANQAGNSAWLAAAQVVQSLNANALVQTLQFAAAPSLQAGGSATVVATASSGLAVAYSSLTPAVCSVHASSGQVQGLSAGSCRIAADQTGNHLWAAAPQATLSLTVTINPVQTLSFAAAPSLTLGGTATVRATASSGLAPVYSSLSPGVCSVGAASGLVTALAVGDCIIAADQPGDASHNPAVQVQLTLSVQTSGLALPGAPSGVSATLGANVRTVLVSVGTASGGGLPITRYTVSSSPAGITASGSGPTVSVSCPVSCAGLAFAVSAGNALGDGPASALTPVLTEFDVLTTFFEPDTQPRNSVFTGRFTLNSTTGEVTGLQGQLTESMSGNAIGSPPYYDMIQVTLSHQLHSARDATLGGRFVASFAKNSLSTFTTLAGGDGWSPASGIANGGIYAGFPAAYNASIKNSYVLIFVPDDPFAALSAAQLARLSYADCAPGGMMGAVCMTATSVAGHGSVGTMSGYPLSQTLSRR